MKLRAWMAEEKIKQAALGTRIHRSQQAVARYCAGTVPDPDAMVGIYVESDGRVEPNDFYELPDLAAMKRGAAA